LQVHILINVVLSGHPRVALHQPDGTHAETVEVGMMPPRWFASGDDATRKTVRVDLGKSYRLL
jgi:hypothetical protein